MLVILLSFFVVLMNAIMSLHNDFATLFNLFAPLGPTQLTDSVPEASSAQ